MKNKNSYSPTLLLSCFNFLSNADVRNGELVGDPAALVFGRLDEIPPLVRCAADLAHDDRRAMRYAGHGLRREIGRRIERQVLLRFAPDIDLLADPIQIGFVFLA